MLPTMQENTMKHVHTDKSERYVYTGSLTTYV